MNTTSNQHNISGGSQSADYKIPEIVKEKFPQIIKMILETESMSKEERNYWFQILPIMTNEQVERLRNILIEEKEQLTKLDDKYQEELSRLNEKHLREWDEFERKQEREKLKVAEAQYEQEEAEKEEDILEELENL